MIRPSGVRRLAGLAAALVLLAAARPTPAADSYLFYVASESDDVVTLVRFTPGQGLSAEKVISVGWLPAELEAPHGVFVDPRGEFWYITLGHGFPFGKLVKYVAGPDTVAGVTELGMFPSTLSVPRFGGIAIAANSDFHGDMVPSSVSIVDLQTMTELERAETCTMPHGSRFSPDGLRHYSACMMDDQLVEVSVADLAVARRIDLVTGERPAGGGHGHHDPSRTACSPTWAAPHPDGKRVYVTCNRSNEIVEVDVDGWQVLRRFPSHPGPYNAEVTPDGKRLIVTHKSGAAVSFWDLDRGTALKVVPTGRKVTHGVVATPDSRYALVTVEGIGGEPGTVEAFDLRTLARVGSLDVGKQAGGIAFWKTVPAGAAAP